MWVLVLALTLLSAALAVPDAGAAEPVAYSAIRIVRAEPGAPNVPEVTLPEGYSFVDGEKFHVASRAEYYTFVEGPRTETGIPVTVRWPGVRIVDVIWRDSHLAMDRADPHTVTVTVPVTGATTNSEQPTIQVWSTIPTEPGIQWRIEHNDSDRVAGPWTEVDWPAGEVRSVISQLVACEAVLVDSGLAATAAAKGHHWNLMGFETNNTLHPDNPPHWHLAYYAGPDTSADAYLPHLWFDEEGKNFYNGMDVTGQGRLKFYVGDPAELFDFAGNLVATMTIRADGGLDLEPPDGPLYSIVPGRDGTFLQEIGVRRDGADWLRIRTLDDVRAGRMIFTVTDLESGESRGETFRYDRLTGVLRPS